MALQQSTCASSPLTDWVVDNWTPVPASEQIPLIDSSLPPHSNQLQEYVPHFYDIPGSQQPSLVSNYGSSFDKENISGRNGIPNPIVTPAHAAEPDWSYYPSYTSDVVSKDHVLSSCKERKNQQMTKIPPQMMGLESQTAPDISRYQSSNFKDSQNLTSAHAHLQVSTVSAFI